MGSRIRPVYDAGSVNGTTGARVSGCALITPARSAAGIYTLTFAAGFGLDSTECSIVATRRGTADVRAISIAHTSDTVKTLTVVDETVAAADSDFDFVVFDLRG